MGKQLHISNGDDLSKKIIDLELDGEILIWREILCEGPTTYELGTDEFISLRQAFLKQNYAVSAEDYENQFLSEFRKLNSLKDFDEIVLWFEFDLFSHLNMLAAISHMMENELRIPVYLVCSKKLEGEKEHNVLSQLSEKALSNHYEQRIHLNQDDLEMASLLWQLYNGENPSKLKNLIKEKTNFEYLSSCLRAHIERFPNARTGLNSLEKNILKLIEKNEITSTKHLLGYSLEYQGYFGYNDKQMQRLLNKLSIFYNVNGNKIELTSEGKEALNETKNFYRELKNQEYFGAVKMYDFLYDSETHNILKL